MRHLIRFQKRGVPITIEEMIGKLCTWFDVNYTKLPEGIDRDDLHQEIAIFVLETYHCERVDTNYRLKCVRHIDKWLRLEYKYIDTVYPFNDVSIATDLMLEKDEEDACIEMITGLSHGIIEDMLDTLTPREEEVLRYRYGFTDAGCMTLREVSENLKGSVNAERVRKIEAKAFMKMRHPYRSAKIENLLELYQDHPVSILDI